MKNKTTLILSLMLVILCCIAVACTVNVETCSVKFSKGVGYVVEGDSKVEKGKNYDFSVKADSGYDIVSVMSGDERLIANEGKYTVQNVTTDIEITVKAQRKTFSVFFVGEGYEANGETNVTYGSNYVFSVSIADGYDKTAKPIVKANDIELSCDGSDTYTIKNVTSDVTITVSGLTKLPGQISISQDIFNFEISKLTTEQCAASYYLQGTSGSWNDVACAINVDLSSVKWDTAGAYEIIYTLDGHTDYTKKAKINLFGSFTIENIQIDLSDVTTAIACLDGYQYVDRDLYMINGDVQTPLNPKQFVAEQTTVGANKIYRSHFSTDFLLSLKSGSYTFRLYDYVAYKVGEFVVTLTDNAAPAYDFDTDDAYAYVVGDSFDFVKAVKKANSAQPIEVKYYLTDGKKVETDCTDGYTLPSAAGEYVWTVKFFRGETELTEYTKSVKYILVENYGWSGVTISASKNGNIVLSTIDNDPNQYTDKTATLSAEYIRKNNTVNGNYMVITLKVIDYTSSGKFEATLWSLKGANNDYIGVKLDEVGSTRKALRMLSGGAASFIVRDFTGSFEILNIEFVTVAEGFGTKDSSAGYVSTQIEDGLVTSAKIEWSANSSNNNASITDYLSTVIEKGYKQITMDLSATQANIYVTCTYKNGDTTKDVSQNYTGGTATFSLTTAEGTLSKIQFIIINTHGDDLLKDYSGTLTLSNITYTK